MAGKKRRNGRKNHELCFTIIYTFMIIIHKREAVVKVRKHLQAGTFGHLAVGSSSPGRSTEDSSAMEQSHTSCSLRKECSDGEKETEDVGMGTENSSSLDGKLCLCI